MTEREEKSGVFLENLFELVEEKGIKFFHDDISLKAFVLVEAKFEEVKSRVVIEGAESNAVQCAVKIKSDPGFGAPKGLCVSRVR